MRCFGCKEKEPIRIVHSIGESRSVYHVVDRSACSMERPVDVRSRYEVAVRSIAIPSGFADQVKRIGVFG